MRAQASAQTGAMTLMTILGVAAICWMAWVVVQSVRVAQVADAGEVLAVGCANKSQEWLLTTSTGTYPIRGWVHLQPRARIRLVTRANGDRWLCTEDQKLCVQTARRSMQAW
jgi:hypothetical protein